MKRTVGELDRWTNTPAVARLLDNANDREKEETVLVVVSPARRHILVKVALIANFHNILWADVIAIHPLL